MCQDGSEEDKEEKRMGGEWIIRERMDNRRERKRPRREREKGSEREERK